jgi:ribonuclease Z
MSRMIILGSGTALPDRERDNTSMAWETESGLLLIDCGGRAYQQLLKAGLDPLSLRGVILTHAHPDHIYGLPALVFHLWLAGYERTLPIMANAPTLAVVRRLCDALDLEQKGHMCAVRWLAVDDAPETVVEETADYRLLSTPVEHSVPCLGLRIEDRRSGRQLVYSSDTVPCATLEALARNAHLLIHEATTNDPGQGSGHTTPYQAGELAVRAGVERLALIHYSAEYTTPEEDAVAQVRAAGFGGEVTIARDLQVYDL